VSSVSSFGVLDGTGLQGLLLTYNLIGTNTWSCGIGCNATNSYTEGTWDCSASSNTVTLSDPTGAICCIFSQINISYFPGNPFSNILGYTSGPANIVSTSYAGQWTFYPPPPWSS
jgi:hypothetical protein